MMAYLYAQAIMDPEDPRTFGALHLYWKRKVYPVLVQSGCEDLCEGWTPEQEEK